MIKKLFISLLAVVASLTASAQVNFGTETHHAGNRVIYELFVRNFTSEGTFAAAQGHVARLKELDVDVVWLMPIFEGGQTDRWGTYNSPYAVKNYTEVDPMYGNKEQFRSLVNAIHAAGMEVWLDWVGNHTSTDNVWVSSHPDYYVWEGSSIKHPMGWNDVYQLNFSNNNMRNAMIDALKYWVREFDIDGYRCDYASGVPRDFWVQARNAVNQIKDITWLAEDGGDNLMVNNGPFDMNYAWGFADILRGIGQNSNVGAIKNAVWELHNSSIYQNKTRMVYLSNHDVVQDNSGTADRHFGANLRPMTVLLFTCYGVPLIYNGQEIAYSAGKQLLAEKYPIDWNSSADPGINNVFKVLTKLKHAQPALNSNNNSTFKNHEASNGNVYVFERASGNNHVVVMLNFGASQATFNVTSALPSGNYVDAFTGNGVNMSTTRNFTLPARGYAVYIPGEGGGSQPQPKAKIRVKDETSWSNMYVYAWAEGQPEYFGSWPGAQITGRETVNGVNYRTIEFDQTETPYNLIFNNGSDEKVENLDGFYTPLVGTLTFTVNYGSSQPEPQPQPKAKILAKNETSWDDMYVYAWAENQPEYFGGWPGTKLNGTESRNGVTYMTLECDPTNIEYNLIFNNGKSGDDEQKVEGLDNLKTALTAGDHFFTVSNGSSQPEPDPEPQPDTSVTVYDKIYVIDKSGWKDLYVYGYVNDQPYYFGAWPGAKFEATETINGVTYKVIELTEPSDVTCNLIFNNGSGGDGNQFDGPAVALNHTMRFTVTNNNCKNTHRIYADDQTGWDELGVYAWGNDNSFLGNWPGLLFTGTERIGDKTYKYVEYTGECEGENLIFNNHKTDNEGNKMQLPDVGANLDGDLWFSVTTSGAGAITKPTDNKIYVKDSTGWETLYIYAYRVTSANSSARRAESTVKELFGAWPGEPAHGITTLSGEDHLYWSISPSETESYAIIFNNGDSGEGNQLYGPTVVLGQNHLISAELTPTGIFPVEVVEEEQPVTFYNLQGVEITNPGPGIYIRRQGTKVTKVMIR